MSTTYRDSCGTLHGMLAHQRAGEDPCGWCATAEQAARLAAEAAPRRALPPSEVAGVPLPPVSPGVASVHRAELLAEVLAFEKDHPEEPGRNRRRRKRAA